jgi:hypothetical protein
MTPAGIGERGQIRETRDVMGSRCVSSQMYVFFLIYFSILIVSVALFYLLRRLGRQRGHESGRRVLGHMTRLEPMTTPAGIRERRAGIREMRAGARDASRAIGMWFLYIPFLY